ncbi:transposase [Streptococcus dysgalactiae subsp. equisimilis]|nr:transposase [Streptococcus dysgalactiae subsp. equisimilis]
MQSQNYYLDNHTQTQVIFSKILTKVITLYRHFVPNDIRNRRNIHLQKQSDVILIASYLWALQEGCRTASAIYRAIRHNFSQIIFQNAHVFVVSAKILLKVFSACTTLWFLTFVKTVLSA